MTADCEHDWRMGPVVHLNLRRTAVCIKCWGEGTFSREEASRWPEWTEQDYWNNLDAIEGDLADEIRAMRQEKI